MRNANLDSAAAKFVRERCQGKSLTALDLNKLLFDAKIPCGSPAQLLDDLLGNGEIQLAGTNPGIKPVKVYYIIQAGSEIMSKNNERWAGWHREQGPVHGAQWECWD